jgi:hypothetical protein
MSRNYWKRRALMLKFAMIFAMANAIFAMEDDKNNYNFEDIFEDPEMQSTTSQNFYTGPVLNDPYNSESLQYIGVRYDEQNGRWAAERRSNVLNMLFFNGYYKNQGNAAKASDDLALTLIDVDQEDHKFNFQTETSEEICSICFDKVNPNDILTTDCDHRFHKSCMENWDEQPEGNGTCPMCRNIWKRKGAPLRCVERNLGNSKYFGVTYNPRKAIWNAKRWNKGEKKWAHHGSFKSQETAAHASDVLARTLLVGDKELGRFRQNHQLNFPDENTEILFFSENTEPAPEEYFGVRWNGRNSKWSAYRWSSIAKMEV